MSGRRAGASLSMRDALYEKPGPRARRRIAVGTAASLALIAWGLWWVWRQFEAAGQLDARYWELFTYPTTWAFIGDGLWGTVKLGAAAGAIAFVLGLALMLGRIGRPVWLRALAAALIEVCRGVPSLLFIYLFTLILPMMGANLPAFWKIVLPVAISAAGPLAEILRAGVNAVPRGQGEAALSLGMRRGKTLRIVILPQAIRYVVPSLIAQLVIVLKDTVFAYLVNYPDLMQNAKVLISNYDAMLSVYLVTAVIYIVVNYLLNKLAVLVSERTGTRIVS